ncbi:arrestin domain-containing protein 3-like [Anopheles bellator]|uniref:arrestin domain-containing protein 3-like n=1 Tax=Anopheles bellator TaxID=139047 RepID=UPI002647D014|nr:arrestin domain-containing protein 3-like [Anopheles bellator]
MPEGCECLIRFDNNPCGVYFPGQSLSGYVELRVLEAFKVKGVSLQIKGFAEVKWSETTGTGKARRTVHYHGRQDYINTVTYLQGSPEGNQFDIAPGSHTYRFGCVLPGNVPTSFEGQFGHIRYTVRVVLHRPWKVDPTYKVGFTVLRHVNLNENGLSLAVPCKLEIQKVFCCGPCASNPLHMSAQIPIAGYVPGQTIAVRIEASNRSKRRVNEFSTKLIKNVSYISQTPYIRVRLEPEIVAEVRCPGVAAGEQGTWDQFLAIPALPTTSNQCQVLTIGYEVEVEGKITGPNINPRVRIPITIGTVPLTAHAIPTMRNGGIDGVRAYPVPSAPQVSEQPETASAPVPYDQLRPPAAAPQPIDQMPPPSYEEAVGSTPANILEEGEENTDTSKFTPQYMIYRFDES